MVLTSHILNNMADRDTTRYELYQGNKLQYVGITNDLDRRTREHEAEGMKFTRVEKVGPKVTRETANGWESDRIGTYQKNHGGKLPTYNKNTSGK